ncbi:copper transporter [Nocardiopsis potens]|uniref:copper transporter n=1 Tax=Nocardiopsis potens TaxID=1246458 RepID=UPI000349486F|nr:copper transporter [Nocardiopsis potens]
MIDFRYHLVSIVAVFLALAVGLVLGTTMLQDPLLDTLKSETGELREQSDRLRADKEGSEAFGEGADQMTAALAEDVLDGRLDGEDVVVVSSPGTDEALREGMEQRIEQAGGSVEGRIAFTDTYLDTSRSAFVDELTEQLAEGVEPSGEGPYERAGSLLAAAVSAERAEKDAEEEGGKKGGFDAETVLAGFAEADLLAVEGDPAGAADIAVVLAPAAPFPGGGEHADDHPPGNGVMTALLRAFNGGGTENGAILVGAARAADPGGVIAHARAEKARYTTVDAAGRPAGDVAAVLALAAAADGDTGHFGIGEGAESFVPDPLPASRASEEAGEDGEGASGAESERRSPPEGRP